MIVARAASERDAGAEVDAGDGPPEHHSPPTLTRTWFHPGPVAAAEAGDWTELDLSGEYWPGDPAMLARPGSLTAVLTAQDRPTRRNALRALRGNALRTELSLDAATLRFCLQCAYMPPDRQPLDALEALNSQAPALARRLCDAGLLSFDDTRRIFLGDKGELDPNYVALRKEHLTQWILRTAGITSGGQLASYLMEVGRRHTGVAGEPSAAVR